MSDVSDTKALRFSLGQFATGVTVVTTADSAGRPFGLTVNSFASVSLNPPLVLWSLARATSCLDAFLKCRHFAVNVLAIDQAGISNQFARPDIDKFSNVEWTAGPEGIPLLENCSAWFGCRSAAQYDGGDHIILLGEVERHVRSERPPLIFHGGRYQALGELPAAPEVAKVKSPMW